MLDLYPYVVNNWLRTVEAVRTWISKNNNFYVLNFE